MKTSYFILKEFFFFFLVDEDVKRAGSPLKKKTVSS